MSNVQDKQDAEEARRIARMTVLQMLGEPEIKAIIRSIVVDQQAPESRPSIKNKSAEKAIKKTPNKG